MNTFEVLNFRLLVVDSQKFDFKQRKPYNKYDIDT